MREISSYNQIYLPLGEMLQLDRVCELDGPKIVCEADLADHWVFRLHFPGDPIFPGTLIIEGAGQTIAVWAWENGLRGRPRLARASAEFHSPVAPEDGTLAYHATVRRRRNLCVAQIEVRVRERLVASIEGTLLVLTPEASGDVART